MKMTGRVATGAMCAALAVAIIVCSDGALSAQARGGGSAPVARGVEVRSYVFTETNEKMEYAVFVPKKVDKKKPAPLVLALHGAGAPPASIVSALRDAADKGGYIVAAPLGYRNQAFFGAVGANMRTIDIPNVGLYAEQDVMNVLDIVRKAYLIDDRRMYLAGHSMGGGGALHIARKHPELWAGVGVAAPALPFSTSLLEEIKHVPLMIVAGDMDQIATMESITPFAVKMREMKMESRFLVIKGAGHGDALYAGAEHLFKFFDTHTKPAAAN